MENVIKVQNDIKSLMPKEQKENYESFIRLFAEIIRKYKGKQSK